jgi:hypothetical protein
MSIRVILLLALLLSAVHLPYLSAEGVSGSALTGTVLDENSEPVHASVTAFQLRVTGGILTPTSKCVKETNSAGQFDCQHLEAGVYVLVVMPKNQPLPSTKKPLGQEAETQHPKFILYPDISDGTTNLLHLSKGGALDVEVTLGEQSVYTIRVQSPSGTEGRRLQIFRQNGIFTIPVLDANESAGPSDDNYVVTGMPSGTYLLVKSWIDHGQMHNAFGSVTVNEFSQNTATLEDAGSYNIFGSIKISAGSSDFSRGAGSNSALTIVLNSVAQDLPHRYAASLDEKGSFVFKNVTAGKYYVSLDGTSGLFVSDIFLGGRREESAMVDVDENVAHLPLALIAAPASSSISGSVDLEGTEPKPGILIHSLNSGVNRFVSVKNTGLFSVNDLGPGNYLLYGWNDIDNVPYTSSRFLERYKQNSFPVSLEANSHLTSVNIKCNSTKF